MATDRLQPRPRTVTRWTDAELLAAYDQAYRDVIGERPSRAALAVLWAQACLEVSRGGAHCYNWNVGNVRAGELEPHVLLPGAYEFAAAGQVPVGAVVIAPPRGAAVPPDRPVCYLLPARAQRFRAYDGLYEGCLGKLGLVARRWPAAIEALRLATGAPAARAYVLGLLVPPAYFTGDPSAYTSSVLSLTAECLRRPEADWPAEPTPTLTSTLTEPAPPPVPVEVPVAADFVATLADDEAGDGSKA